MVSNDCKKCGHSHPGRDCHSQSYWEDDPQDRAPMTEVIDALRAATDKIIILRTALRGLVEASNCALNYIHGDLEPHAYFTNEYIKSIKNLKAAIAAAEAEMEGK